MANGTTTEGATPDAAAPITFLVPGTERGDGVRGARDAAAPSGDDALVGTIVQSVAVERARARGDLVPVVAQPGRDVVVLQLEDGPELVLHPEHARQLIASQSGAQDAIAANEATEGARDAIVVPSTLQWAGGDTPTTRGLGRIGASLLRFVLRRGDTVGKAGARAIADKVDAQQPEGVRRATRERLGGDRIDAIPSAPNGMPSLVLLHGTFSTVEGTFGALWRRPTDDGSTRLMTRRADLLNRLFDAYDDRVFGFEHATLGRGPIENALALAERLPDGAQLHLLTHSRGGLVAEVLARAAAVGGAKDATNAALAYFDAPEQAAQRTALDALLRVATDKALRIDRVVRVAATARGTLLASRRLDAYLSVIRWALRAAGIPVVPDLVALLGVVAQRRTRPDELPGLEAQMPDSALVRWLNDGAAAVPGELRVVAGDMTGDSIGSWLRTLVSDAYFWTDNDLVVQTRSMYGGGVRGSRASFVLARNAQVTHFRYFANDDTARQVVDALVEHQPQGFRPIGAESQAGRSSTGVRGRRDGGDGTRPALLVVPMLFGSVLGTEQGRAWPPPGLDDARGDDAPARVQLALDDPSAVAESLLPGRYAALVAQLSSSHDVISVPYDWRAALELAADTLATALAAALDARGDRRIPVRILAHEAGGLVVRTLALRHANLWRRFAERAGSRVLMLGVPHDGCWTPLRLVAGDDDYGGLLAALAGPLDAKRVRDALASAPGVLALQASLRDPALRLDDARTWRTWADADAASITAATAWHDQPEQRAALAWGVPPQTALDAARALRQLLDDQLRSGLAEWASLVVQVAGVEHRTPVGVSASDGAFAFVESPTGGDGRVPLASVAVAGLPTWIRDTTHGELSTDPQLLPVFDELLRTGATNALSKEASHASAEPWARDGRARRGRSDVGTSSGTAGGASETQLPRRRPVRSGGQRGDAPFSLPTGAEPMGAQRTPLRLAVRSGDVRYVDDPILIGHYRSENFSGAEQVLDSLLEGELERTLALGIYPEAPRTAQVFRNRTVPPENPWQLPRPSEVIVVGLGEEGMLRPVTLTESVRVGVLTLAQRLADDEHEGKRVFDLSATLVGSGGTGITVHEAAQAVARGVCEAKAVLEETGRLPCPASLTLVELFLSRATEAWRALRVLDAADRGSYVLDPVVQEGMGSITRPPDEGYRGSSYDFVQVSTEDHPSRGTEFTYRLDTRRARTELRAQQLQSPLVRELVRTAADDANTDPRVGLTLFSLLVPLELRAYLSSATELVLGVDPGSAPVPWEVMDDGGASPHGARGDEPLALRVKVVRKLLTEVFRDQVRDARRDDGILVIGDPRTDGDYLPLPGARREAVAVHARFDRDSGVAGAARLLVGPEGARGAAHPVDAVAVMNALFERSVRVLHVAAHGEPPETKDDAVKARGAGATPEPRGIVLSNGTHLGARELNQLRIVPELVFVNTCHGARGEDGALARARGAAPPDRPRFAASVAQSLIEIGVRCVVAAGWAVADDAAAAFAEAFYDALLDGMRFIDAVDRARHAAHRFGGATWAAFQCYGDPEWRLVRGKPAQPAARTTRILAEIASARGLVFMLEEQRVRATHGTTDERARASLRLLALDRELERERPAWADDGHVADALGRALAAAGHRDKAVRWLDRAAERNDGATSLRGIEERANLRGRVAWERFLAAVTDAGGDAGGIAAAATAARADLGQSLEEIDALLVIGATLERHSLRGSAYKRLAMIARELPGGRTEEHAHLVKMIESYEAAAATAAESGGAVHYPLQNVLAGRVALRRLEARATGRRSRKAATDGVSAGAFAAEIATVKRALELDVKRAPSFWNIVGEVELSLLEALLDGTFERQAAGIGAAFARHHERCSAPSNWQSVADQLRFLFRKRIADGELPGAAGALLAQIERYTDVRR